MKLLKFVYTLILFTVSSFTFAGYYPAKVNADLNLYTDFEFNKPVILVNAGAWLNTMPMFSATEIRYGTGSIYIAEQDKIKLGDKKSLVLEKGIFDDEEPDTSNSYPDVLIQKDTPIYSKSVLSETEAEIENMPTLFTLKATDVPCQTFKEIVGKSGKTFYKISFNDEPSYILKEDTSIIQQ